MTTAEHSYPDDGPTQLSMSMFEASDAGTSLTSPTSSLADFLVSLFQSRAFVKARMMIETCGLNSSELFGRYDPDSSCWRTLTRSPEQLPLMGLLDQPTPSPSLQTLPAQGTMHHGELYQQPTLEQAISEIAGGAWPTPTASDIYARIKFNPVVTRTGTIRHRNKAGSTSNPRLQQVVYYATPKADYPTPQTSMRMDRAASYRQGKAMVENTPRPSGQPRQKKLNELVYYYAHHYKDPKWPTPTATDNLAGIPSRPKVGRKGALYYDNAGSRSHMKLPQVTYYATPKVSDAKGTGPYGSASHRHDIIKGNLRGQVIDGPGDARYLNPEWALMLMGFPPGWLSTVVPLRRSKRHTHGSRSACSPSRKNHPTTSTNLPPSETRSSCPRRLPSSGASVRRSTRRRGRA